MSSRVAPSQLKKPRGIQFPGKFWNFGIKNFDDFSRFPGNKDPGSQEFPGKSREFWLYKFPVSWEMKKSGQMETLMVTLVQCPIKKATVVVITINQYHSVPGAYQRRATQFPERSEQSVRASTCRSPVTAARASKRHQTSVCPTGRP